MSNLRSLGARLGSAILRRWKPITLILLVVGSGCAGAFVGTWRNICQDCPSIAQLYVWEPIQSTKVYARDGRLVTELFQERRTPVALESLPPHVPQAFVAIEDKRFYGHEGFDYIGIGRAAFRAVINLSFEGGGGSTITQQLARNMFKKKIGFEKRIQRKLKEARVSRALEETYTKEQILEAYINQINYGPGWWGIEIAARRFFGIGAAQLNPAQAAMLAAVVRRPGNYLPFRHPDRARSRRNLVLEKMAEQGYLPRDEAEQWKEFPLPEEPHDERATGEAPYFVEWVRRILDDRYGSDVYRSGLRVHTTLDLEMQEAANRSMEKGWAAVESRPGFDHPRYREYIDTATVETSGSTRTPYLQGLFIALDPATGDVRALIGGRDFEDSKFNRATQALRQPGSGFKPFAYTAALASGIPASHVVVDAPVVLPQPDGTRWRPRNFTEEFHGPLTLREGLRRSVNIVAIKLGQEVGLETVAQYARRLGIRTRIPRVPSMPIGAASVVPMQLAEAYTTFATMGTKVKPRPIIRVEDAGGTVLWEPEPERSPVLDRNAAAIMVDLLRDVVNRGTGANARTRGGLPYGIPAAGKTGTTNEHTNVWFTGFTPDLLAMVWFGFDRPQTIYRGATGGGDAAPVWGDFMHQVYVSRPPDSAAVAAAADGQPPDSLPALREVPPEWELPPALIRRSVDARSGGLATEWCPAEQVYDEIFIPGTEPTRECDLHGPTIFDGASGPLPR